MFGGKALTKKSKRIGLESLGKAKREPPPPALVSANSEVIDVKTAPTAASKAFPPDFKISRADSMKV